MRTSSTTRTTLFVSLLTCACYSFRVVTRPAPGNRLDIFFGQPTTIVIVAGIRADTTINIHRMKARLVAVMGDTLVVVPDLLYWGDAEEQPFPTDASGFTRLVRNRSMTVTSERLDPFGTAVAAVGWTVALMAVAYLVIPFFLFT